MAKNGIGKTLKLLMMHSELKTMDLARATGIPQPTLHRIITGATPNPHRSTLETLADYFEVTLEELKGEKPLTGHKKPGLLSNVFSSAREIPIITPEQAAIWPEIKSTHKAEEYAVTNAKLGQYSYAMKMYDASMEPVFEEGSTLIIDFEKEPKDRSYAIIVLKGQKSAIFRQVLFDNQDHYLRPLSPDLNNFQMHLMQNGDEYRGVLVQALRNFDR